MPLPREAWKVDSLESGPQDLPIGYDPQATPVRMTDKPVSAQGIEAISDNTLPYTGEGDHHIGRSHQVSHSNSAKNPTEVNLDVATLVSPSGEEHNVPSKSS